MISDSRPLSLHLDREVFCMGTRLGLHLEGPDRDHLRAASTRMVQEVERIEAAGSTHRDDGPWRRLNAAQGSALPMAAEWLDLLGTAQAWQARTRGAFDPVLKALMAAWGIREGGVNPTTEALDRALQATGVGLLVLDRVAGTARLLHPDAGVEEGGFVKGYALDAALRVAPVPAGWLDFGGQILSWGGPRDVAIADPDDRQRPRLSLTLPDGASLSCTGCSERGRHLLDPRSGLPCLDWGLVAVVARTGLEAELLSTALYVEGPEAGPTRAWAEGVAAAFLLRGGEVIATRAWQLLHPVAVSA